MAERFLKFIPSEAAIKFAIKYKNAFVLLMIIAESARRTNGDPDGLTIGQCHLGSHPKYGMTEKEYRYAKQVLVQHGLIKIVVTNRTRKKSEKTQKLSFRQNGATDGATDGATEPTTTGTLVELCNSDVWDINPGTDNQQKGDRKDGEGATQGRLRGDKQECKEREEVKEDKNIAQSPKKAPRSKDSLSFDFTSWKFTGITEGDREDWRKMYPSIDLDVEILKAAHWLKDNPSKSGKTLWRKYLTGWLKRNNEWAENKKAYQSAKPSASVPDRRTKDVDGNPVENQYKGKF